MASASIEAPSAADLLDPERFAACRERAGLSQRRLAISARVSVALVEAIEQGRRRNPRIATMARLLRGLGARLEDVTAQAES